MFVSLSVYLSLFFLSLSLSLLSFSFNLSAVCLSVCLNMGDKHSHDNLVAVGNRDSDPIIIMATGIDSYWGVRLQVAIFCESVCLSEKRVGGLGQQLATFTVAA